MQAHADTMANQQGNGQNGSGNHHREDDDHRDTDYRGMGQSGYGSGRDADDHSMGTRNRNDYGRGRWEEGRMGYSQGYSYRDGDRPSFERGMHDYDRGYGRSPYGSGYEEHSGTGTREQQRGPQGYGGEGASGYGRDRRADTREQGGYRQDSGYRQDGGYRQEGGYRQHQTGMGGARGLEMPKDSHRGKGPKNFQMSDDRVRERVCEALHEDHDVDASDVEVSVSKGEVTLMGTVEDRQSKRLAEDCVLQCAGVRDVHNQLRVRR